MHNITVARENHNRQGKVEREEGRWERLGQEYKGNEAQRAQKGGRGDSNKNSGYSGDHLWPIPGFGGRFLTSSSLHPCNNTLFHCEGEFP